MNRQWADQGYSSSLVRIFSEFSGIERVVGLILFAPCLLLVSYLLDGILLRRSNKCRVQAVEYYVVAVTLLTVLNWSLGPNLIVTIICSYFSVSTGITLLQVVFLHKVFGEMHSPSRSLILLICNVVQILFMYAAWYQLEATGPEDMLFAAVLVLATIGHPEHAPKVIVELQIATDFTLLVVFLNHLVSRLGSVRGEK
jgi:hypothetical protein